MNKVPHPRIVRKPYIHQVDLPDQATGALTELIFAVSQVSYHLMCETFK